ncbi:MAG TPA: PrsW family intramembrane metalloprotease [Micromonosporaceae bacterium]
MPAWTVPPQPELPPALARQSRTGAKVLWLSLLIAACSLAVIGIVTYVGWNIGPVALAVGITGAILPVPVLAACFLWLDRYQPSPLWIMITCFLWGAGVATSGALAINMFTAGQFTGAGLSENLVGVLVAPFAEELLKAAFPLLLFAFYRKAYSGIIDGIVYCGLSATGFAMVENILYLGGHGFASQSENGYAAGAAAATAIFIVRVPLTGFAHPLFTSMTGIGLGLAARSPHRSVRILAPLIGLLVAMMLHGSWNLIATLAQSDPYLILYGYFAVFMPIFLTMVGAVLWVRSWEGRLAERVLPVYVAAGWFSPPEVAALGTLGRRLSARSWARRVAGDVGKSAMRGYQVAATQLAQVRDGLNRGLYAKPADLDRAATQERQLLHAIDTYRRAFTGRDPLTPPARWHGSGYQIRFPDGVVRAVDNPESPVVPVPFAWAAAPAAAWAGAPVSSAPAGTAQIGSGAEPHGPVGPSGWRGSA